MEPFTAPKIRSVVKVLRRQGGSRLKSSPEYWVFHDRLRGRSEERDRVYRGRERTEIRKGM